MRPVGAAAIRPLALGCAGALVIGLGWVAAGCRTPAPGAAPSAKVRAIQFLQREVPAWSRDNRCFSCHNNGDAARALYAASRAWLRVPSASLADTTVWVAQPELWDHNKGDPGFSDQRLADLQFAASLLAAKESGHMKDTGALKVAARRVAAGQDPRGAWPIEPHNPVGSPATWGTALATFMAWQILVKAEAPGTQAPISKAARWLQSAPADTVPAAAVKLMAFGNASAPNLEAQAMRALAFLYSAQTPDGGWGPYQDSPPEAFDTALVLLALAGIPNEPGVAERIARGRTFLISMQQPDGGWPATTRPSGGDSYAQRMSTTGWAAQALLKTGNRAAASR